MRVLTKPMSRSVQRIATTSSAPRATEYWRPQELNAARPDANPARPTPISMVEAHSPAQSRVPGPRGARTAHHVAWPRRRVPARMVLGASLRRPHVRAGFDRYSGSAGHFRSSRHGAMRCRRAGRIRCGGYRSRGMPGQAGAHSIGEARRRARRSHLRRPPSTRCRRCRRCRSTRPLRRCRR